EALNGSADVGWTYSDRDVDIGQVNLQTYGAGARVTVPVWRFLGASATATTYRLREKVEFSDLGLGFSPADNFVASSGDSSLGAALFARDPQLGRLQADYAEELQSNAFSYSGDLQIYLARWTLAAGVTRSGVKDVPVYDPATQNTTARRIAGNVYPASITYYPAEEVRLNAGVTFIPGDYQRVYAA